MRATKTTPEGFREQVLEYLREEYEQHYVSAATVAEEFGVSKQRAGRNLFILYQNDELGIWNDPDSKSSNTYVIDMDHDDA